MKKLQIEQMEMVNGGGKTRDYYFSAACGFGLGILFVATVATGGLAGAVVAAGGATAVMGCGASILGSIYIKPSI